MVKAHTPINWENEPSYNTPLNAANLNKMDSEIGILDDRIIEQDTIKLDKSTANTMVKAISFDENTGVFTITLLNGSTTKIDTKLEKVVVNFSYDATTQQIIINLVDGTKQYIDLSALITQYEFVDSQTIAWEVTTDGKVKAKILDGSITENMLQPNYLAEIKVESAKAETNAIKSQSYAVGGTASRQNEDIDNAMYYYNQAKSISESFSGALKPMGTVTFENLPSVSSATEGDMYNVSDQFTTTSSFKEGSGNTIPAGSNVYKTSDGFWDVLAGSPVTGVKGNAETSYRRGNVNITASNIGLGNVNNTSDADKPISTATQTALNGKLATNGDSKSNTVTFTSNDVADGSATSWTSVTALASGITHATFFQRVSQMFKNVRYLYKMLGTTNISSIGNGTVTGAISTLNSNLTNKLEWILVANITGQNTVDYSSVKSGKTELLVIAHFGVAYTNLIIPIPSDSKVFYHPLPGYYINSSDNFTVTLAITNNTVVLNTVLLNGNNITSDTTLGVYIR